MSRLIPTEENVFELEPYRSILNLLTRFQEHKGGLEQKHFRYALCKNHDFRTSENKDGLGKQSIIEMEGFFGKQLNEMIQKDEIKTGIVTSKNNLNSNYIRRLIDLGIIYKKSNEERNNFVYFIDESHKKESIRISNINRIKRYSRPDFKIFEGDYGTNILYGINEESYDNLPENIQDEIVESLEEFETDIFQIREKINEHLDDLYMKKLRFMISKYENPKLIKLCDDDTPRIHTVGVNKETLWSLFFDIGVCIRNESIGSSKENLNLLNLFKDILKSEIHKCGLPKDKVQELYNKIINLATEYIKFSVNWITYSHM